MITFPLPIVKRGKRIMSKILVKKVKPCELSTDMIFQLNFLYKTELGKFIAIADQKSNTLFVNDKVPDDDIEKMITIAGYEGKYINNPDCEIANVVDFIYEKYGFEVYDILSDFYQYRKEEREKNQAKEEVEEFYQKILAYTQDEEYAFWHMEYILYYLQRLALNDKRKTPRNLVGCDMEYTFLLGFLMGNGTIKKVVEE